MPARPITDPNDSDHLVTMVAGRSLPCAVSGCPFLGTGDTSLEETGEACPLMGRAFYPGGGRWHREQGDGGQRRRTVQGREEDQTRKGTGQRQASTVVSETRSEAAGSRAGTVGQMGARPLGGGDHGHWKPARALAPRGCVGGGWAGPRTRHAGRNQRREPGPAGSALCRA